MAGNHTDGSVHANGQTNPILPILQVKERTNNSHTNLCLAQTKHLETNMAVGPVGGGKPSNH